MTTAEPLREPLAQYGVAVPTAPPVMMDSHERTQMRMAALRATRVFPGAVGELISKELSAWEQIGIRLGGHGLIRRLVAAVMSAPLPVPAAA